MDFSYLSFWISVLICLGYLYVKRAYSYWKRNKIPYVEPKIPFGNLEVIKTKENLSLRLASFYRKYKQEKKVGSMLGLYFFFQPVLLVVDVDLVRHIFIKDFQYFQHR